MKSLGDNYRPEIDGLRAVSILCVVFFHLGNVVVPGGYIGVDVFFVISGYLITRNIIDDMSAGKFSLPRFYTRRIRRLFPALLFTITVTFLASALWFPPDALRSEARNVIATLLSVSNIQFWRETNQYFALNAKDVPLLHTWSLSVEEQFYLVWSAGLSAIAALRWQKLVPVVVFTAGVASLVACQHRLSYDPVASFYLMPYRIFELSIGALCIWAERWSPPGQVVADLLFSLGLGAILGSAFIFTPATPFPGVRALLPCLGAAFVIFSGARARFAVLLNNRLAIGIGLVSYSLYLCHWPILVFARYIFGEPADIADRALLFALSLSVSILMYLFIEKPFRFRAAPISTRTFSALLGRCAAISAPLLLLAVSAAPVRDGGWPWRLTTNQQNLVRLQSFGATPCLPVAGKCVFGDTTGPLGLEIIGDSHAEHLVAVFQPLLLASGLSGQIYAEGACIMLAGIHNRPKGGLGKFCQEAREGALSNFSHDIVPLVIAQAWRDYVPRTVPDEMVYGVALENTFEQFGGRNRQILIVGPQVAQDCQIDTFRLRPGPLQHAALRPCPPYPLEKVRSETADINAVLQKFQRAHAANVSLLMPADYLCGTACPIVKDDLWLYTDGDGHLTVAGSEYLGQRAHKMLERFINAGKSATLK